MIEDNADFIAGTSSRKSISMIIDNNDVCSILKNNNNEKSTIQKDNKIFVL